MIKRSQAVGNYLKKNTHADLAELYNDGMEVQVNMAQDDGQRVEVGDRKFAFTDGISKWGSFRMPAKAMSEPVDNDAPVNFDFDAHVEGIGMTGWDWKKKVSRWVTFDFDAMLGHSDAHTKKLSEHEMMEVQNVLTSLPYVTLRKSTSGRGLHLYIFLNPIPTNNHTEHAALARSVLSYIAGTTGYNFSSKVDICGGNTWVWHRKMRGTDGLKLIKAGSVFDNVPKNWRDHLTVVSRKSNKTVPKLVGVADNVFNELCGQRAKVKLDEEHLKLMNYLADKRLAGSWDADNHMLTSHTAYLRDAHRDLGFRGQFETMSTGKDYGNDINCFSFPLRNGGWAVHRFGQGTQEHKLWTKTPKGFTKCYLNRELDLADVCRLFDATELENGGYQFPTGSAGREALLRIGVEVALPDFGIARQFRIKLVQQDTKIVCMIPEAKGDPDIPEWPKEKGYHRKVVQNPRSGLPDEAAALGDYDDMLRHIISENGEDMGWVICTDDGTWRQEPVMNVRLFMQSKGISKKDIDIILGRAVNQAWVVVCKPFQPEYPGNREWNRSPAQFKIVPTLDGESLSFPTWEKVLSHCGRSLDGPILDHKWCKDNAITSGSGYLKMWLASLFKYPEQPLPYLAFYGPQDSGKSTFHEAVCQLILDGGYMDGALALQSDANFNGELQGSILCTLEEVDLRDKKIYQKVKDWVTSNQISIHAKGQTPYKAPNYTHWVQAVNDRDFIPKFPGDTRICVLYVDHLSETDKIPKRELWQRLQKEASDFLAALLSTEIPDSRDRLMLPVVKTVDAEAAEYSAMNPVEQFFKECVHRINGASESQEDVYQAFITWLDNPDEAMQWSKSKFLRSVPQDIQQGRISEKKNLLKYLGNISLKADTPQAPKWNKVGLYLKRKLLTDGSTV